MMAMFASVLVGWLPTAGAIAGVPLVGAGLRAWLSAAALLWFGLLRLMQQHASWIQNPWAGSTLTRWPDMTTLMQAVGSALLVFTGLRLIPAMAALAASSLGVMQTGEDRDEDGASMPETSLTTLHFVLLATHTMLADNSGGLVRLLLPDTVLAAVELPAMQVTSPAAWLVGLLQQCAEQAIQTVAPFLMAGVLAELIVAAVRGARRAAAANDRWRPIWVLGILMMVAWYELGSGSNTDALALDEPTTRAPEVTP
jgi:hypothetical protein